MSEECDGRACRGPCIKDDCLLLRLSRGRPPMDGDEAPVSEYVNGVTLRAAFERQRDDIVSGNVWPDRDDPMYLEWLERRVSDLTSQLATAEELLAAADRRDRRTLNVVVAQLEAEEHRPPPRQS